MFAPMKLFLLLRDEPCRAGVEESERLRPDGSTRLIHVRKATFSRHTRVREAATSGTNCEPTLSLTPPGPGSSMFFVPYLYLSLLHRKRVVAWFSAHEVARAVREPKRTHTHHRTLAVRVSCWHECFQTRSESPRSRASGQAFAESFVGMARDGLKQCSSDR
jgi:hypothetical protein